ncbi:hypothetical protein LAG73_11130 [Pseudoxanthomonas japonensis]|nr:hypothetical protein LAG73_11130 [Pseudoxanthomonas japonensis]
MKESTRTLISHTCALGFVVICLSILAPIAGDLLAMLCPPEIAADLKPLGTIMGLTASLLMILGGIHLPLSMLRSRKKAADEIVRAPDSAVILLTTVIAISAWTFMICAAWALKLIAR